MHGGLGAVSALGAWGLGAFGALARCGFGVLRLGVASASVAPRVLQAPRVFKVSAWCPTGLPVPAIGRTPTGRPSRPRTRSGGVHAWIVLSGGSTRPQLQPR